MYRKFQLFGLFVFLLGSACAQDWNSTADTVAINRFQEAAQFIEQGKLDDAIQLFEEYASSPEHLLDIRMSPIDRVGVPTCIGYCYYKNKQYEKAIPYLLLADSLQNLESFLLIPIRCDIDEYLTLCYYHLDDLENAEVWGQQNLRHQRRLHKNYSKQTADAYFYLYRIYQNQGDVTNACDALRSHLEISMEIDSSEDSRIADIHLMVLLSHLYYSIGKNDDAIQVLVSADALLSDINPIYPLRLRIYNQLYLAQMKVGNIDVADEILSKAFDLSKKMDLSEESTRQDYFMLLNNAMMRYQQFKPKKAVSNIGKMIQQCQKTGDTISSYYAALLNNYAAISFSGTEKAITLTKKALEIISESPIVTANIILPIYIHLIDEFAVHSPLYDHEIYLYASKYQDFLAKEVNLTFSRLTETERLSYWSQVRSWYHSYLPYFTCYIQTPEMLNLCYNGILQSKGMLLGSAISVGELISMTDDPLIKEKHVQLLEMKSVEDEDYREVAEVLEQQLLKALPQLRSTISLLHTNTDSIRAHLAEDAIAIEFLRVPYDISNEGIWEMVNPDESSLNDEYVALVLKADYSSPHLVKLFKERDLRNMTTTDMYYNRVWRPLKNELDGIRTIFFSPDSRLYTLPIEYATLPDGECMMDKYSCYRLSSTREIVLDKPASGTGAVVYGGIKYNESVQEMLVDAQKYPHRSVNVNRSNRYAIGVAELPATLKEANRIADLLNNDTSSTNKVAKIVGTEASEASFKALSGQRVRIIHVATHGFFLNGESDLTWELMETGTKNKEESALSRCGLLFAGAGNILTGKSIPSGVEDGLLDANEISRLDLHGVDLVVLSACETAQGDISSDGVLGLQRGFKMAGANSILMSLWKVDDEATCLLMTEFYKNWLNGMSKNEALRAAKNVVRSHTEKEWDKPEFWAAFILLDGLD